MKNKNFGLPIMLASIALNGAAFADSGDFDLKPNGCRGVTLCTAYADCIECHNMHLDIGFLLEEMRITNTTFGYLIENSPCSLPACATLLRPNFKLNCGITASAGYYFDRDGWFLEANFDWLSSRTRSSIEFCDEQRVVPTGIWSRNSCCCPCGDPETTACSNGIANGLIFHINDMGEVNNTFRVNYYMLQVSLNRASYITHLVSIEPHWGLKAAWINYRNKTHFCHVEVPSGAVDTLTVGVEHRQKTNFWGVGPHFGIDTRWALCEGFSFFCDNSVGILVGTSTIEDCVNQDPTESTLFDNQACCHPKSTYAYDKLRQLSPVVRAIIGLEYNSCVCDDTQNVSLKVGFDTHFYWNQWQHIAVIEEHTVNKFYGIEEGTFGLFGLIVEFGWDF